MAIKFVFEQGRKSNLMKVKVLDDDQVLVTSDWRATIVGEWASLEILPGISGRAMPIGLKAEAIWAFMASEHPELYTVDIVTNICGIGSVTGAVISAGDEDEVIADKLLSAHKYFLSLMRK